MSRAPLPGWDGTETIVLISPHMGARFTQYLATMNAGDNPCRCRRQGHERVLYVLEGEIFIRSKRYGNRAATPDQRAIAFLPAGPMETLAEGQLSALASSTFSRINRFVPLADVAPPEVRFGQEQMVEGVPFLGDPDAVLKTFLPTEPTFDLAVNLSRFRPGAALSDGGSSCDGTWLAHGGRPGRLPPG